MFEKIKKVHTYFTSNKKPTLPLMWVFFFLAFGYAMLSMFVIPSLPFFWMYLPAAFALYFRLCYTKAAYDPRKDKSSDQYIPYSERPENKHKANRKKKK